MVLKVHSRVGNDSVIYSIYNTIPTYARNMKKDWHFIVHGFATVKQLELEEARIRTKKRILVKKIWKVIDKIAPKELARCDDKLNDTK